MELFRQMGIRACSGCASPDFLHFPDNGKVIAPRKRTTIVVTLHDVLPTRDSRVPWLRS